MDEDFKETTAKGFNIVLSSPKYDQRFLPTDSKQRDEGLHKRFMQGDTDAFAELWECYEFLIVKNCNLLLHNYDDAIDAKDEIREKAFINFHLFDPTMSFVPWIKKITKNHCLNIISKNARHQIVFASEGRDYEEGTSADVEAFINAPDKTFRSPLENAANKEQAVFIEKTMEKLSSNHRQIITLYHFEDYSYDEIAKALNIPIGTVMSRLFNARADFQKHYKKISKGTCPFE